MSEQNTRSGILPAFGMTSLVLGHVALIFFFLPILGIPIGVCGVAFGVVGMGLVLCTRGSSLRWSVAGVVVSLLALSVNLAIWYAPEGYLPGRNVPQMWNPAPDRPYVPPPALGLDEEESR